MSHGYKHIIITAAKAGRQFSKGMRISIFELDLDERETDSSVQNCNLNKLPRLLYGGRLVTLECFSRIAVPRVSGLSTSTLKIESYIKFKVVYSFTRQFIV